MIRLGHTIDNIRPNLHNGPGWRISLWTQGCQHRCTQKCLNPHYLNPEAGYSFEIAQIMERIRWEQSRAFEAIEGLTLLGGEPLEQPDACAELLEQVQELGLSTMVYTGFTYEYLQRQTAQAIHRCLKAIDLLVDGPFLPKYYDARLTWRGSSNQRLLCLNERYTEGYLNQAYLKQGKSYSIQMKQGHLSISGFQESSSKF